MKAPKIFKYSNNTKKFVEIFLFSVFKVIIKVSYINYLSIT